MDESTLKQDLVGTRPIHRFFGGGTVETLDDEVIKEYRLAIDLDGKAFVEAVISPSLLREFVVGFLRTRGLIDGVEDISSLEFADRRVAVTRCDRLYGVPPELTFQETTGSRNVGPEGLLSRAGGVGSTGFSVTAQAVMDGIRMLSHMPLFERTGGTHCAILFSMQGEPILAAEDIGRHNAVDKAIGGGLMKGADLGASWLAVSGRLPADMVFKPLLVGIPLVASVSAPTWEGIELGKKGGICVVGFTRGGRLNCYTFPERIRD